MNERAHRKASASQDDDFAHRSDAAVFLPVLGDSFVDQSPDLAKNGGKPDGEPSVARAFNRPKTTLFQGSRLCRCADNRLDGSARISFSKQFDRQDFVYQVPLFINFGLMHRDEASVALAAVMGQSDVVVPKGENRHLNVSRRS